MLLRPKKLIDVTSRKKDPFKDGPKVLNLYRGSVLIVPIIKVVQIAVISAAVFFFFLGLNFLSSIFVMAPTTSAIQAAENDAERKALEDQLTQLESQIAQYQDTISSYKKQGNSLKSEINQLNAKIAKLNLQIKAINLTIDQLDKNISMTEGDIKKTEDNINDTKSVIGKLLEDMYENEGRNEVQILLENPKLSDFFNNLNSLVLVQDNLRNELVKITALRDDLVDKKEGLALERSDAQATKDFQDSQRVVIQKTKSAKDDLLKVTKGQESKYQELLTQTQKTAAEIRNRIFRLLGGGELPFGEAVKIAKVAEKAIGIRAALILAVLTQESSSDGVIGRNLGKCYYNDPRDNGSGTVMAQSQKPAFLAILADLGLDPSKTPVSCPIVSDGAYGGAMGPAQFMPNTWNLYRDRVGLITGGKPPSPFNNLDAFTATALYLNDGMEGCRASFSSLFDEESCTAAKYYAGKNWRSYMRVGRYGYRVADRATGFEQDIEVLEANGN